MRRLLALLPLCLSVFVGGALGATYQFTDPSAALTAIPTMTASDTMQLGCTLAGPVTLSAGTYDVLPGYSWSVTGAPSYPGAVVLVNGSVTLKNVRITETSANNGRAVMFSGAGDSYFGPCIVKTNNTKRAAVETFDTHNVVIDKAQIDNPAAKDPTLGCIRAGAASITVRCSTLNGNGTAYGINGVAVKNVSNCSFYNCAVGVSIVGGGTFTNNLFYNVTAPVTGASATFMTNSAWNGNVSTWGAGCVSFSGNPFYGTPTADNPWTWRTGPWFPGNFSAVSIAGVTDQPSIIGIPTGKTIGAVPYLSRGRDDGEDMIRE